MKDDRTGRRNGQNNASGAGRQTDNRQPDSKRSDAPGNRSGAPGKRFDAPGKRFDAPDKRSGAPGKRFSAPGKRFDAPGKRYDTPDNRSDATDNRSDAPGKRFDAPGKRFDAPGKRFDAPDKRSDAPGKRFSAPGKRFDAPGNRSDAPDSRSDAPGNRSGAPGKRSDAPDNRSGAPGKRYDTPGKRSDAPGKRADAPEKRYGTPRTQFDTQGRKPETEKLSEAPEPRFEAPAVLPDDEAESRIEGRNAVLEALKAGRTIDKVYIAGGDSNHTLEYIASLSKQAGAVISRCDRRKLDAMSLTHAHQGVIAVVSAHEYADIEDMLKAAEARGQAPLLILCDGITDPHNLGAIIRTAETAGAHGVIIPKRRSAGLTAVVDKAAAGALEYMPVARVSNLSQTIAELKKRGIWVFGTSAEAQGTLYQADFNRAAAIVIGSEGDGMSRLVTDECDFTVSIPLFGKIASLNASAAAAVLLYEVVRQRMGGPVSGVTEKA